MSKEPNLSKAANAPAKPKSMIDMVENAVRQANWDATQGPEHLRAGRFDPGPSDKVAKPAPEKG